MDGWTNGGDAIHYRGHFREAQARTGTSGRRGTFHSHGASVQNNNKQLYIDGDATIVQWYWNSKPQCQGGKGQTGLMRSDRGLVESRPDTISNKGLAGYKILISQSTIILKIMKSMSMEFMLIYAVLMFILEAQWGIQPASNDVEDLLIEVLVRQSLKME